MKEELKPCPFCGCSVSFAEDTKINEGGVEEIWFHIHCDNLFCYAQMRYLGVAKGKKIMPFGDKEELIKAWNKRV